MASRQGSARLFLKNAVMLAIDNRSGFAQTDHMKSVLEILADGLSKRNIQALLIGGHALQPYGVVRQTLDVDCLVADQAACRQECAATGSQRFWRHRGVAQG